MDKLEPVDNGQAEAASFHSKESREADCSRCSVAGGTNNDAVAPLLQHNRKITPKLFCTDAQNGPTATCGFAPEGSVATLLRDGGSSFALALFHLGSWPGCDRLLFIFTLLGNMFGSGCNTNLRGDDSPLGD